MMNSAKSLLLITVFLGLSVSSFAQSRSADERAIERYAQEIQLLSQRRLPRLTDREVSQLRGALENARAILMGRRVPPTRVCLHDPSGQAPSVQRQIERVAKDYFGLFTFDAEDHAEEWMAKYPCSLANQYEENAEALFKTAREVFDLFKFDAEKFTKENVEKVCDASILFKTAQSYYDLGRSRRMSTSEAEQYAQARIAKDGFYTCQFGQ